MDTSESLVIPQPGGHQGKVDVTRWLAEISYLVNHGRLLFLRGCSSPHQQGGEKQRDHLSGATSAISLRLLTLPQPLSFTAPPIPIPIVFITPPALTAAIHPAFQFTTTLGSSSGGKQTWAGVNTPSVGLLIREEPYRLPCVA